MLSVAELLGDAGPLARHLPGFAPRPQQQALAGRIAAVLETGGVLVSEAGTGTGKTLAYLVPVLRSGRRVIISTATKTLQDQLHRRDIPLVRKALGAGQRFALLKGRANYLCRYRLALAAQAGYDRVPPYGRDYRRVRAWAARTESGDIEEVQGVPADSPVWPQVTSTADNCLGQDCPEFSACHVMKARRAAQESDVVVINHHLLFSDMMLKEGGFGELLPGAEAFIIDEAHQLPEIAARFFGHAVSAHQLLELGRDALKAAHEAGGDMPELPMRVRALEQAVAALRRGLGEAGRRAPWAAVREAAAVKAGVADLRARLAALTEMLAAVAERDKGLEHCRQRALALGERFAGFAASPDAETTGNGACDGDSPDDDLPDDVSLAGPPAGRVTWFETSRRGFVLHDTPLDIAEAFQAAMARYRSAWVFTSATLAVGRRFEHFTRRLGITEAETAQWDSPFDYARHALLYLPPGLPEPNDPDHTAAVVRAVLPVLRASGGRAFLLFTSHRALRAAAARLGGAGLPYPLLVQGEAPRSELLARFRALGNAVLLGTSSFWEGVDVRGAALSCVIVDRLPFAPPDDPVFQARAEALRRAGGNPFRECQLPHAVITLKQGVGRLIRDVDDRGVLVLCDPRLLSRPYGRTFLANLPPMPRSRDLADVEAFFAALPERRAGAVRA